VARSPWIADLRWVRTARQPRSQRTLGLLLDAAEALISEKGIDDLAVGDVAARAGCSIGAFYHHFRDKDALIRALLARLAHEFRETMDDAVDPARWAGASITEILEAYLEFSLELGRERAGLRRAQLALALRDAESAAELVALQRELSRRLAGLLEARRDDIGHPDPDRAIPFALEQLRAMLTFRLEAGALGSELEGLSDADFVCEAIASVCAYLQILPPPASGADSQEGT
jgi:AcrR family transcriptional regulator